MGRKKPSVPKQQEQKAETSDESQPKAKLTPEEILNKKVSQKAEAQSTKANAQLTAAYRQKNLKFINMLIAEFAKSKELRLAKRAWNLVARCELVPTIYTLTNMVNAYVRCGKMKQAVALLTQCQHFLRPNEVTFTAIIKGFGESGQVEEAATWVGKMRAAGVELNLRTFQILLRSALHWGYPDYAEKWWTELCKLFVPSEPCLEYWIKILCQSGLIAKAWEQLDLTEAKFGLKATATALSDLAIGSAISGQFGQARRALLMCRSNISLATESSGKRPLEKSEMTKGQKATHRRKLRKLSQKEAVAVVVEDSKDATFIKNRLAEVTEACQQTTAYLGGGRRSQFTSFLQCPRVRFLPSSHHLHQHSVAQQAGTGGAGGGGGAAAAASDKHLSVASKRRQRNKKPPAASASASSSSSSSSTSSASSSSSSSTSSASPASLDFAKIFNNNAKVMVEVCSGNGDWIVNRALVEPSVNWVAIEVRVDRCYAIFSRMAFQFVPNLLVVCGDARAVLRECFSPASVHEVYINYPEPPGSAEQRLLDSQFFELVANVLAPSGMVVMVSDEATYVAAVLRVLKQCPLLTALAPYGGLLTSKGSRTTEELDDYGSSYFDKHWKQRRQLERYMLRFSRNSMQQPQQQRSKDPSLSKKSKSEVGEEEEEENEGEEEEGAEGDAEEQEEANEGDDQQEQEAGEEGDAQPSEEAEEAEGDVAQDGEGDLQLEEGAEGDEVAADEGEGDGEEE